MRQAICALSGCIPAALDALVIDRRQDGGDEALQRRQLSRQVSARLAESVPAAQQRSAHHLQSTHKHGSEEKSCSRPSMQRSLMAVQELHACRN
jgi:hypothetical protein